MPVRVYDIAKKLGLESKNVLQKAKELGIPVKVASSQMDRITAEYLEEQLAPVKSHTAQTPTPVTTNEITEPLAHEKHREANTRTMLILPRLGLNAAPKEGPHPQEPSPRERKAVSEADPQSGVNHSDEAIEPGTGQNKLTLKFIGRGAEFEALHDKLASGDIVFRMDIVSLSESSGRKSTSFSLNAIKGRASEIDATSRKVLRAAYHAASDNNDWVTLAEFGGFLSRFEPKWEYTITKGQRLLSFVTEHRDFFDVRFDTSQAPPVPFVRLVSPKDLNPTAGSTRSTPNRITGRIHNLREGYGFIAPDTGGENYYFHNSDCIGAPFDQFQPNTRVTFVPSRNDRGLHAKEVQNA